MPTGLGIVPRSGSGPARSDGLRPDPAMSVLVGMFTRVLPMLISALRSRGAELAPLLIREAGRIFPGRLSALDKWVPPWRVQVEPEAVPTIPSTNALVDRYQDTARALEALLTSS